MVIDPMDAITPGTLDFLGSQYLQMTWQARTGSLGFNKLKLRQRNQFAQRFDFIDVEDIDCRGHRLSLLQDDGNGLTPYQIASRVLTACERSMSDTSKDTDLDQMRRLQQVLHNALALLSAAGGTVLDVPELLLLGKDRITRFIVPSALTGSRQI